MTDGDGAGASAGERRSVTGWLRRRRGWLPSAVSGERREMDTASGRLSYYFGGPDADVAAPPLLLVHSVNAAAAAHEVRSLYEHYRSDRSVYAIDLPGYGFSERAEGLYIPRTMTDALHALIERMGSTHGGAPVDVVALSLSCEFAARAATERPETIRSLAFVAPTGFNRERPFRGEPGATRGRPRLYRALRHPIWSRALFNALTCRPSVRYFLEKTWGSKAIDEQVFDYSWRTAREPGAHYAPYSFLSGFLFSADISRIHEQLRHPVWMVHGVRGDFTDYRLKRRYLGRPNWRIEVFDTGAMPHFESPAEFTGSYDAFLEHVAAGHPVGSVSEDSHLDQAADTRVFDVDDGAPGAH